MKSRNFSLKPFPPTTALSGMQITGNIERSGNIVSVSYALVGPLSELGLAAPAEQPSRKNSLWEETCFELFLGVKNSVQYWEFNITPAGHWNVYHFRGYRQGMREELAITSLQSSIECKPDSFRLSLEIDLDKILPADQELEAAVSAVIKPLNGPITYWALVHTAPQADFHRRDGFVVSL